ncbi:MAG: PorT family protein [Bacteroidetes bacterium]|nr:PorT family protein [Bacteroidota bacterium]
MKKIFFFTLCFLFPVLIFAQQFKVGLLGGISTSQVDGDTYAGYNKAGIYAGGFVSKNISSESKWSAVFEITYIQKGSRKLPHPDKGDFTLYKLNLNYAEVPVLLKYSFTTHDSLGEEKIKFQFEGGIAVATLVQSREEDNVGLVIGGIPFEKKDISYLLGLNYPLGENFSADVRFEYSMLPVRKSATGQYYQNWTYRFLKPGYYNNLILFSLRYQF